MQALWILNGSGVLLLRDMKSALALVHYESSPVGAYDELAVIQLSWRGPSVVEMLVTSEASRQAGRALWGFPKELGNLSWRQNEWRIVFQKGREVFRFRVFGFSFPLRAKAWTNQVLNGQNVRVPCAIEGRARIAFRGQQLALVLEDFQMQVFPPTTGHQSPTTEL